jgi:hypothetical protein
VGPKSHGWRGLLRIGLLAGVLLASAGEASQTLGPVGGSGGSLQGSTCNFGPRALVCDGPLCQTAFTQVMVGVQVHTGRWLDRVRGLCVDVDRDGTWRAAVDDAEGAIGSPGGQPVQRVCPRNFAVVGMRGRADWYVDQLRIGCQRLTSRTTVTGDVEWLAPVGGTGGRPFGPLRCSDRPVYQLLGKGHVYVDSLRMVCR